MKLAKFVKHDGTHFVNFDIFSNNNAADCLILSPRQVFVLMEMGLVSDGPYDGSSLPGGSITPREDMEGEFHLRILTGQGEGISR